ncbi:HAD family hydrolase [Streptomyces sp. PSKA54]|uniref:HAD family hydrolase n=1 Tax=Streptomyces himalayensis subsp. aureolus TaxID=2758039 RepID=A0A7W2D6G0_9ACTN|nr:HAD family hydrolase [Streptomyces himalayensis subsp. aureolus]
MVRRPLGNHHHGPDTFLVTPDTQQTELSTEPTGRAAELTEQATEQTILVTAHDQQAAEQTEPVAAETENLRELITRARFVLFDFDGPICRLFAGHKAEVIAEGQVRWLEERGLHGLLTEGEREHPDPHEVLRAVDRRHTGSDLVAELEERLTQQELRAVDSAWPTAYADPLIRTWLAVGSRLAITTNNSPRAVRSYLATRGLEACFTPHIYGRTQDLHLLKPHPHCLNRALSAMGAEAEASLMIGDTPSDFQAAEQAGVPFLGYARNARKEKLLRASGAEHVVNSLELILNLLRAHA